MAFTSLISRSVLQSLNLYYSFLSLSDSSHSCTLLCFYFPFYPSPLILLNAEPFIFLFSCFIVRWIACSPFLIPLGYHVCLLLTLLLPLSLYLTLLCLSMRCFWQKLPPTVTEVWPTREFGMPGPGTVEWNHASLNTTQTSSLPVLSDPSRAVMASFLLRGRTAKCAVNVDWHLSQSGTKFWKYLKYCCSSDFSPPLHWQAQIDMKKPFYLTNLQKAFYKEGRKAFLSRPLPGTNKSIHYANG